MSHLKLNTALDSTVLNHFFNTVQTSNDKSEILIAASDSFQEFPLETLKVCFYVRDIKMGLGNRIKFEWLLKLFAYTYGFTLQKNLKVIFEFGRWSDLLPLLESPIHKDVIHIIKRQLSHDINCMKSNEPCSLLAKWLPSINTSSSTKRQMAKSLCHDLNISYQNYRKLLSKLRTHSNVLETRISKNNWKTNYDLTPKHAHLKYKKAFLRHDEDNYRSWSDSFLPTPTESRINSLKELITNDRYNIIQL